MGRGVRKRRQKRREPPWGRALLQRLTHGGVPRVVLRLIATLLVALGPDATQHLDALELFSGRAAVTTALREAGFRAYGYDIDNHIGDQCNWLSSIGFVHALCCAIQLEHGAFSMNAPVCSTWGWINRATSGRTVCFPAGNVAAPSVAHANVMVSRMVIMLRILTAMGVWWVLEQPAGSFMFRHRRMQDFLRDNVVWRSVVHMATFGALTSKPSWLYSNRSWCPDIAKLALRWSVAGDGHSPLSCQYENETGRKCVDGLPKALKESQQYTPAFGRAIADVYARHRRELQATAHGSAEIPHDLWSVDADEDPWSDANMADVVAFLGR